MLSVNILLQLWIQNFIKNEMRFNDFQNMPSTIKELEIQVHFNFFFL